MAFGFSSKHSQVVSLSDLTPQQFIAISIEVCKTLKWKINKSSTDGMIAITRMSMSSWGEAFYVVIENGEVTLTSKCTGSQTVDWGKNRKNIHSFLETFNRIKASFDLNEITSEEIDSSNEIIDESDFKEIETNTRFLNLLIPSKKFFFTPIIIYINVCVFILMILSGVNLFAPSSQSLIDWGANFKPATLGGEWWRLITCCFLHIGILHLLLNMYALIYIGMLLEPLLGRIRFIVAYLLTGIVSSTASLWWNDSTVSAGASGAIFGMYGLFLALLTSKIIHEETRKSLLASIGLFVFISLTNGLKGGIDNAAHIGGLISGLLIGYAFIPSIKNDSVSLRNKILIGISIASIALCSFVYHSLPNDLGTYDAKIKEFAKLEQLALEVFRLPEDATAQEMLSAIQNPGLTSWKKIELLLQDIDKLDIPNHLKEQNEKLKKYCELRIQFFNLYSRQLSENTEQYTTQLNQINLEIETLLKNLNGEKK